MDPGTGGRGGQDAVLAPFVFGGLKESPHFPIPLSSSLQSHDLEVLTKPPLSANLHCTIANLPEKGIFQ